MAHLLNPSHQTLSGKAPYYNIEQEMRVFLALFRGIRPERPPCHDLMDDYWELIQRCWDEPALRPCADEVYASLLNLRDAALKSLNGAHEDVHPLTEGHPVS